MNQKLSPEDIEKVNSLTRIREWNNRFSWLLFDYLNDNPCMITRELVESVSGDGLLSEESAFFALLTGFCGLETESGNPDRIIADEYFRQSIKKLDASGYRENPYFKNILIPTVRFCNWELKYEKYEPFEAFIFNEPILKDDFKEIPRIGFFSEPFHFPCVMEDNHEWMAIKPDEIETMQPVLDLIGGNVVTFGLGLGYFAYMASLNENVRKIVVVEHDARVIQLFEKFILPQFSHKEKVEIVECDAFEFIMKQLPQKSFDCAFVDLWHDVSDGLEIYLRIKKLELINNSIKFYYWIEDTLLSALRSQLFDWVINNSASYDDVASGLSNNFLKKIAETNHD
ncbi:MAG TPA: hypothetical protein PLR88_09995 [Bacteroidales bacterium]|nr:hypothetical protein [Bacteroidales bacterium]HPT22266.1 hypothetical protein [Bacteroidales bacterium]